MKSKFALSFGIALMAIGTINLFINTNNIILFGISLSAFIFSLINILFATKIYDEKYEFLYIFPLLIMLCFFCYGNELMESDIIKTIVNGKLTSALTFISFGISFVSEYIIEKNFKLFEKIRHLSLALEMMDYTNLLQDTMIEYRKELNDKKIIADNVSQKFAEKVEKLFNEKAKKAKIENELLSLKKDLYSIDDFDKIYTRENDTFKLRNLPDNKNKDKKYK